MGDPLTLPAALALFDRKERRLVIEKCLGHEVAGPVDCKFLEEMAAVGIKLDDNRRWFTDYHIDWLVGALCLFQTGWQTGMKLPTKRDNKGRLVRGNQEDIDLLPADDATLVCVEAKWFASWEDKKLECKVRRVLAAAEQARQAAGSRNRGLDVHFLLMSVRDARPHAETLRKITGASAYPIQLNAGHRPDQLLMIGRADSEWRIRAAPKLSSSSR